MAGEAVCQISGSDDYSIRNLTIKLPLVLKESGATEVLLSFKPAKLTDSLDSAWYDFVVSSCERDTWTRHCTGQVRSGGESDHLTKIIRPFPRRLRSETWYTTLSNCGFDYGPTFRNLENISATPVGHEATANLKSDQKLHGNYIMHPVFIDQGFQLLGVAACQGIPTHVSSVGMPAAIGNLYIARPSPCISVEACIQGEDFRSKSMGIEGEVIGTSEEGVVFWMKKITAFTLELEDDEKHLNKVPLASRIAWKPDIDLLPPIKQLNLSLSRSPQMDIFMKIIIFCALEVSRRIQETDPGSAHITSYEKLVNENLSRLQDIYSVLPGSGQWTDYDTSSWDALSKELTAATQSSNLALRPIGNLLGKVLNMIEERASLVDFLIEDGIWSFLYGYVIAWTDWSNFFSMLGHSNSTLNVIEIDGSGGAATAAAISSLHTQDGIPLYSAYTFTDASPDRVAKAKDMFSGNKNLHFTVLDINKNPAEQGFEGRRYDVVAVSNMVRSVTDISNALLNIRSLLAPGGWLLFYDQQINVPWIDNLMGALPQWWMSGIARSPDSRSKTPQYWDSELRKAGFSRVGVGPEDHGYPWDLKHKYVCRVPYPIPSTSKEIFLLHGLEKGQWPESVQERFYQEGYKVNWCTLENPPPAQANTIALLDVGGPFFDNISKDKYNTFLQYFADRKGRTLWVTKSLQMKCDDPKYGFILGLARTLRHEAMLDFATFEIDDFNSVAIEALLNVYEKLERQSSYTRAPEHEFVLHRGIVHIGRFQWLPLEQLLSCQDDDTPKELKTLLELGTGQVEVKIDLVGLNFRDLMVSLGIITDKAYLGLEAYGIISRVGHGVDHLHPGDRVLVYDTGLFSTRIVTAATFCLPVPNNMSPEDATTLPTAYATAIHSLIQVGQLRKGQSVLVHSACDAVGQAAICVCLKLGAEIYATVGSEQKTSCVKRAEEELTSS
ncbi:erythronolide synthase, modules 3 and 4 [Helicocarpus griseus UAMH5409]|uniref:Erythronolide synthase, modules 3 and 4 n=1 Tax=Helicocarpus griseus UAMH5409 TaxID=1447875 RepID=A0A2B7Y407_9EURO|nr:erythronolide synthase, modules 3 and 4 [Helicocarpus griseus UAMH5409]